MNNNVDNLKERLRKNYEDTYLNFCCQRQNKYAKKSERKNKDYFQKNIRVSIDNSTVTMRDTKRKKVSFSYV